MIGKLNNEEIDQLLDATLVGHLGCHFDGRTYIVPISFARQEDCLFGYTTVGKKVQMMRGNPDVCVQVENITNLDDWQSAIVWGRFEELSGTEEIDAMVCLVERYSEAFEALPSGSVRGRDVAPPRLDGQPVGNVLYRIRISEKTGRFERPDT